MSHQETKHICHVSKHLLMICLGSTFIAGTDHFEIFFLVEGLIAPCWIPFSLIKHSHSLQIQVLKALATPISAGWQSIVYPPGMCSTSTPNSWICSTTDAIIWHLYKSKNRILEQYVPMLLISKIKFLRLHEHFKHIHSSILLTSILDVKVCQEFLFLNSSHLFVASEYQQWFWKFAGYNHCHCKICVFCVICGFLNMNVFVKL